MDIVKAIAGLPTWKVGTADVAAVDAEPAETAAVTLDSPAAPVAVVAMVAELPVDKALAAGCLAAIAA